MGIAAAPPPRLNPFAFPSDTNFRFALLLVTLLSASLFIFNWVLPSGTLLTSYDKCASQTPASPATSGDALGVTQALARQSQQFDQCRGGRERERVNQELLAGLGLLVLTAGIYVSLPALRRRRAGFVPLTERDAPEVVAELSALASEAGLTRSPRFVWNPFSRTVSAVAFGVLGRYEIGLTAGLVMCLYTDPEGFRAILRHELAHIRNRDINKTYLTVGLWLAFAGAVLAPFVVVVLVRDRAVAIDLGWRVLGLTLAVYLLRNAVLRARESFADVRASIADGRLGALGRVLGEAQPAGARRWRRFWIRLWRVHPDQAERRRAVEDPGRLFRLGFWDACATGLAVALAYPNLEFTLQSWLTGIDSTALGGTVAVSLVLGGFTVGVIGPALWRAAFTSAVGRPVKVRAASVATGLTAGLLGGHLLSFEAGVQPGLARGGLPAIWTVDVLWAIAFALGLLFIVRWTTATARHWLERAGSEQEAHRAMAAGLSVAGLLLVVWFGMLFLVRDVLEFAVAFYDPATVVFISTVIVGLGALVVLGSPVLLGVLVVTLAFSLAAFVVPVRRLPAGRHQWGFLDPVVRPPRFENAGQELRLAGIIRPALLSTALYLVIAVPARVWFRTLPQPAKTDSLTLAFYATLVLVAVAIQGYLAVAVTTEGGSLAVLRGVSSSFLAGTLMAITLLTVNLALGGGLGALIVIVTVCLVVNLGSILALAGATAIDRLARAWPQTAAAAPSGTVQPG